MSNAYIIQKQAAIGLLERPMDDLYFGNISLGVYRRQALRRSGIKSIQHADLNETISGPALIVSDDVFISQRALRAF